ncbi:hypothetical protein ACCS33_07180 [Rhizobium ruizarguesonis]|uniref:hypothetical protein n=1 Tax=Rhizobium TaxID=379 RepID=UPI0013B6BF60|nr:MULTISPECIES: hypothetical protein [Rhizobium]NEI07868.1 hypothetical protein [Rhizobium ruizarguesonis]NEJ46575.1 hypothetical protein [Rhizobium leguminosarum]NEJ53680.1 hypothetical protein [Rhizobium leguminosarum]
MSRIPQPAPFEYGARPAWRPEIAPADYSDEVSDMELEALRKISANEIDEHDLDVVDGPAW